MQSRKLAASFVALIALTAGYAVWGTVEQQRQLDALLAQKNWLEAESLCSNASLPVLLGTGKDHGAAKLYLESFFADRGGDEETSAELNLAGDKKLKADDLGAALDNLIHTAEFAEYRLKLPEFSEACARTAVQVAGRRLDDATGGIGDYNMSRALLSMGQICKAHQKLLIAELAFRESIATAGRAYRGDREATIPQHKKYGEQLKESLKTQIELLEKQGKKQHLDFLKKRLSDLESPSSSR